MRGLLSRGALKIPMSTPSPPTKSFPTKSPRVELSGRLPIKFDAPLRTKSLLESNPLKSKLLVGGLGVHSQCVRISTVKQGEHKGCHNNT